MRESVVQRKMPPWHADPAFGEFSNDARLTDEEIAIIDAWVKSGTKKGEPEASSADPVLTQGWHIKPDVVLTVPEFLVSDRKSTRLNSSHSQISYAVFCLKKKNNGRAHAADIARAAAAALATEARYVIRPAIATSLTRLGLAIVRSIATVRFSYAHITRPL